MTRYELGFLTKCAEAGVRADVAIGLLKRAAPAPVSLWKVLGKAWRPAARQLARGSAYVAGGLGDDVTAAALRRFANKQPTAGKVWNEFAGRTDLGRMLSGRNMSEIERNFGGKGWENISKEERAAQIAARDAAIKGENFGEAALHENALGRRTGARAWAADRTLASGRRIGLVPALENLSRREATLKASLEAARAANNVDEVAKLTSQLKNTRVAIQNVSESLSNPEAYMRNYLDAVGRKSRTAVETALSDAIGSGDTALADKLKAVLAGKGNLADVGPVKGVMNDSQAGLNYIREARRTRNARLAAGGTAVAAPTAIYALSTGERAPNEAAQGGYGSYADYFK